MEVRHLMTTNFVRVTKQTTALDLMDKFLTLRQDIACVIEDEKLVGIVTKYSLYRLLLKKQALESPIASVIKRDVVVLQDDETVYNAKNVLIDKQVGHAVVLNAENKVIGVMAKSDLITGLISSSNHLLHRLQSLINNLQEGVISLDSQLRITSMNETAVHLLQVDEKNILNQPVEQLSPALAPDSKKVIKTGAVVETKRMYVQPITAFASFFPIKEWGKITGAMVVLKDVTDFEKIASELESTKRIEKILDSALEVSYDGVVITDNDGNITKANLGFLHLYGFQTFEDILDKPITQIAPDLPFQHSSSDQPLAAELIQINGQKAIFNQMPIYQAEKKIGTIYKIIYQQLDEWKDLFQHMEKLENELTYYRSELSRMSKKNDPFFSLIAKSEPMEQLKKDAFIAAKSFSNVLITGETGTGKELLADGIHRASNRNGAFVQINCAAIPENLLESELFGYAEGAFTGARKGGKPGKFELADQGTLFLDEIGDMPPSLQVKLLRVLQEKKFERVGDTKTINVDVRIIAATNKDLFQLVKEGTFREDLYYRIHVIHLHIPPLRERLDDIPILTEHFIRKFKMKTNKDIAGLTPESIEKLQSHHWSGNVRELENILERAFHFADSKWIEPEFLFLEQKDGNASPSLTSKRPHLTINRKNMLNETDKKTILKALKQSEGNRTQAAKMLGIGRSTLYQKLKKYDIQKEINWY